MITALIFILKGFNGILYAIFSNDSFVASWVDLIVTMIGVMFIAALSYCSAYVAFKDVFLGEEI